MTLYTWRALSRGWDEPNWRIALFWAPLFVVASAIVVLIVWLAGPLPRWSAFVIGLPFGVGVMQAGAWLAGATIKPADQVTYTADQIIAEALEALGAPQVFLTTIPATQMEWSGPPARKRPCWRCMTYRRWPRDRRHFGCAKVRIAAADYIWLPEIRDQD